MKRKHLTISPGERIAVSLPNGQDRLLLACDESGTVHIDIENLKSLRAALAEKLVSLPTSMAPQDDPAG